MNAMNLNKTLIRREFWENRSLWIVPAVTVGVLGFFSLYMLLAVLFGYTNAVNNNIEVSGQHFELNDLPDFAAIDPSHIVSLLQGAPTSLAVVIGLVMQIVVFFYLLDSLYADRRDRSVFFWRSMPVSDTRSVLAKLATAALASTAITLVATVALELLLLLFVLIGGSVLGVHTWVLLAHPWGLVSGWLILAYALIAMTLWSLPNYAWLMFASGWARKAPILWALLPPLGVIVAEAWVFHTGHFARLIFGHTVRWLPLAFNVKPSLVNSHGDDGSMSMAVDPVTLESMGRFLSSPELWVGLVIAAGLVAGAIWLRRRRTDI